MPEMIIQKDVLKSLVVKKLTEAGVNEAHAEITADVLVHADLRGVHSHGVLRTEHYVKRIKEGGLNPAPQFLVEQKGTVAAYVDGDNGLGHVVAKEAMDHAIASSKQHGIGVAGVINSSHCGALSYFAEQAAKQETVSMIMTHTDKVVVPFGGAEPYFGTNPIAYGFPARKHQPVILDMATSTVAFGKVLYAREAGVSIPNDWGVDENGISQTDPALVKSLLPFGGPKGYGLALMVDVLSGILTGSAFGPHIKEMYEGYDKYRHLGHFIITIDPGLFTDKNQFLENVDQMIDELHQVKPAEGSSQVMVPGEPEQRKEQERLEKGIPIQQNIYNYLTS